MAQRNTNAFNFRVFDESRSSSGDDTPAENVVCYVATTAGALATLYTDRSGNATLANPFEIDNTYKAQKFYTTEAEVQISVFDYGDISERNHLNRIGRHGHIYAVTPTSKNKHIILPRYGTMRIIAIPLLATGTDSTDTPNTWDNAEANAVILNGSSTEIALPKGFVVTDVFGEVLVVDSGATVDVGLASGETGGDANGFIDGMSLATLGFVRPNVTRTLGSSADYYASTTRGALLADFTVGADTSAATIGNYQEIEHVCDGTAKTISVSGSSGIDTASAMIYLKGYMLPIYSA
jgi:hypothetical protein